MTAKAEGLDARVRELVETNERVAKDLAEVRAHSDANVAALERARAEALGALANERERYARATERFETELSRSRTQSLSCADALRRKLASLKSSLAERREETLRLSSRLETVLGERDGLVAARTDAASRARGGRCRGGAESAADADADARDAKRRATEARRRREGGEAEGRGKGGTRG